MILRKVLFVFLIFTVFSSSIFAIEENKIKDIMEKNINLVINILQEKEKTKEEKTKQIFSLMDKFFDYEIMSQISLGRDWKTLSNEQKKEFIKAFETKLKNSYIDKLDLYTDQKIEIDDIEKLNAKRIKLLSYLIGKDDKYEIEYKFYKNSKEDWLIYDVNIIGVSIMQTYRQQFSGFLKDKSFEDLLLSLNNKK